MSSGGEPKQLTDGDWDDKDPNWSPDGTRIAFASSRAEDRWQLPCPDIYVLSIEKGQAEERRATIKAHEKEVPLTDEERRTTTKSTRTAQAPPPIIPTAPVPTEGNEQAGELRRLTDGTRSCFSPSWSPDGKTIAFLSETQASFGQP